MVSIKTELLNAKIIYLQGKQFCNGMHKWYCSTRLLARSERSTFPDSSLGLNHPRFKNEAYCHHNQPITTVLQLIGRYWIWQLWKQWWKCTRAIHKGWTSLPNVDIHLNFWKSPKILNLTLTFDLWPWKSIETTIEQSLLMIELKVQSQSLFRTSSANVKMDGYMYMWSRHYIFLSTRQMTCRVEHQVVMWTSFDRDLWPMIRKFNRNCDIIVGKSAIISAMWESKNTCAGYSPPGHLHCCRDNSLGCSENSIKYMYIPVNRILYLLKHYMQFTEIFITVTTT